ncbi:MAG: hypothetical protein KKD69_08730 [Euryarchaeota archaeon]|nr:hypothetical protein [Euryarchaeota archaeon]
MDLIVNEKALKVEKLLKNCNNKIRKHKYELVWWSFINNFEGTQKLISDDFNDIELDNSEVKQFIKLCDNRLDRSKVFLHEIAIVLGFDFAALTIIATIAKTSEARTIRSLIENSDDPIFISLILFLIGALMLLFILLGHYRTQVHAWTAFKEKGLLQ